MKKKILRLLLIILIVIGGFAAFKLFQTAKQLEKIDKTPVEIEKLQDGRYKGKSETELVKVEVDVLVSQGKIKDIELIKHECGRGQKARAILDRIIEENDIEVDSISGATVSSEIIKDALRKALREGKQE